MSKGVAFRSGCVAFRSGCVAMKDCGVSVNFDPCLGACCELWFFQFSRMIDNMSYSTSTQMLDLSFCDQYSQFFNNISQVVASCTRSSFVLTPEYFGVYATLSGNSAAWVITGITADFPSEQASFSSIPSTCPPTDGPLSWGPVSSSTGPNYLMTGVICNADYDSSSPPSVVLISGIEKLRVRSGAGVEYSGASHFPDWNGTLQHYGSSPYWTIDGNAPYNIPLTITLNNGNKIDIARVTYAYQNDSGGKGPFVFLPERVGSLGGLNGVVTIDDVVGEPMTVHGDSPTDRMNGSPSMQPLGLMY